MQKVGASSLTSFQCDQVRSLVNDLQKQYVISHLLTRFELYLVGIGQKKKLLSGLYFILLTFNSAEDIARTDWGCFHRQFVTRRQQVAYRSLPQNRGCST